MKANECSIALGEGVATVKRRGTRRTTVAKILGTLEADGVEMICLDRLVHGVFETEIGGWQVSGAITTMLARPIGPLPEKDTQNS